MKRDKLNFLLRDWAARHVGDPAQRETLVERMRQEIACRHPPPVIRRRLSGRTVYAACGFTAGLLVAVGLFVASRWWRGPVVPGSVTEMTLLSAAEIARSGELFRRMEEVFPGDLRWIAETNGEVSLGLSQSSGAAVSRAAPLVIRTVVLQRKPGESSWHRVFTVDVLSRSEELVEVAPSQKPAGRLLVWAYRLPDGNVAVDAKLRLTDTPAAGVDLTSILAPGHAAQVFTARTADGEFRVLQAASPLSS